MKDLKCQVEDVILNGRRIICIKVISSREGREDRRERHTGEETHFGGHRHFCRYFDYIEFNLGDWRCGSSSGVPA
jgi:hypothetical protein